MSAKLKYILAFPLFLIIIHSILYLSLPSYQEKTSISKHLFFDALEKSTKFSSSSASSLSTANESISQINTNLEIDHQTPQLANATFVSLVRNSELWEILSSIRSVEDRFNRHYHYPMVFLNDVPFDETFINRTKALWSGPVYYGLVPKEQWEIPEWIDKDKAAKSREQMESERVIYGGSISYRSMCRYQSGFFFKHHLLDQFKWYWRVEPNIKYYCDIDYDPFLYMEQNDKHYGFTITMPEFRKTIVTLWDTVKNFTKEYPQHIKKENSLDFLSNDGGETYNTAHFWSNFEIGNLDFWRSQPYQDFFNYLDRAGGFWYERWGDAPVHSIAAGLLLEPEQIHFFEDIGYDHNPYNHCPDIPQKCYCDPSRSQDLLNISFNNEWKQFLADRQKTKEQQST